MSPTQYDADKMYTSKEYAMRSCRETNNTGETAVGEKLWLIKVYHFIVIIHVQASYWAAWLV